MCTHTHAHNTNEGNGCVVNDNVPVQEEVTEISKVPSETMHPKDKVLSPIVPVRLSEIFSEHVTTKVIRFLLVVQNLKLLFFIFSSICFADMTCLFSRIPQRHPLLVVLNLKLLSNTLHRKLLIYHLQFAILSL
jgi:hypothetical protein